MQLNPLCTVGLLATTLSAAAFAQGAQLTPVMATLDGTTIVNVHIDGASGSQFQLFAAGSADSMVASRQTWLASGSLDSNGSGVASFSVPAGTPVGDFFAVYRNGTRQVAAIRPPAPPTSGGGVARCQQLDFDYFVGPVADPVAGQIVDIQWAVVGLNVSAVNNTLGHPDKAIIFDSANITGGDDDLATPGFGPGNTEPLGKLLILAENDIDLNGDGLVDDPDDEEHGGILRFTFAEPSTVCRAVLVDIDDSNPTVLRFTHSSGALTTIPVDNLGENSVQTLDFAVGDVMAFEIVLGGSGGVAEIWATPCPFLVNLDENSYGVPLDIHAGTVLDDEFVTIGLTVSAINNNPLHPHKLVIFDSENPTGGDDDLITPGPGLNNDTPLGFIVVIAENDIDLNGDGLIDDPDDEEAGGRMIFDFEADVNFFDATLLDVDGTEEDVLDFYDASGNLITTIQIGALGDNSVQRLALAQPIPNVRQLVINLTGSGAVTRLRWCLSQ